MRRLVLGGIAALALAGCGEDDKRTLEQFASDAEEVCRDLEEQSRKLAESEPKNLDEVVDFAQDARETTEDAVDRIEDLETPEGGDGEKAQQWKDAVKDEAENKLLPALDELEKAAEANDEEALVEAAQNIQQIEATESDRLAREIGAEGCAD